MARVKHFDGAYLLWRRVSTGNAVTTLFTPQWKSMLSSSPAVISHLIRCSIFIAAHLSYIVAVCMPVQSFQRGSQVHAGVQVTVPPKLADR